MSILSVDQIQPIGSGTTVTLNATEIKTGNEITIGTGTSIFSPAGNTLTFGTNNVERIRIKNDGKVGINTSNTSNAKLEISDRSTGTFSGLAVGTQYGTSLFGGYNNYPAIMNSNQQPLIYCDTNNDRTELFGDTVGFGTTCVFRVNGAERFRIGSAGQLGIAGANYGDAGQVLKSQGSGTAPHWSSPSGWVFGNAGDYDTWNSTTDVRLSGWPTNWQQIRISFTNISSNANAYIQFFVSKSSDPNNKISSGYENKSGHFGASQTIDNDSNSAIMGRFMGTASAGYSLTGHVNFYNFRGDTIRYEGQCSTNNAAYMYITNGKVTCDPTAQMTHIFFRCQGYSYDSGRFKIDYLFG